jgi:phosphoribosylformylglycinamidine (FGAM) synthase-like amidotransferase family enzyme
MAEVLASPSIFTQGMEGSQLPIAIAHGEGYANFGQSGQFRADSEPRIIRTPVL